MPVSVFFNPQCGTCRTTQSILAERGVEADYVRYLEQAPDRDRLVEVMKLLDIDDPREMMRPKEPVYDELGLADADPDRLLDAIVEHPILLQRPIVVVGDRAVIARPAERVLELLDE
jgi:arsenate reductase